jgi:hypothetical protein
MFLLLCLKVTMIFEYIQLIYQNKYPSSEQLKS